MGAGATGLAVAERLVREGSQVRQITRRGAGLQHPLVERVAADARDAERLAGLLEGAETVINCAMPPYDRWITDAPPLAAALLSAVERAGIGYVMLGNLYAYGHVDGPFTEGLPIAPVSAKGRVRAQMWLDALAAFEAGRANVTEVRAAAFLGAGAVSTFTLSIAPQVLAGEVAKYAGRLDVPQSWSFVGDVAETLVAAARDGRSWGRAWHVPAAVIPVQELTERFAELTGAPAPRLERLDQDALRALSKQNPVFGELVEMLYATENPHILDSTETERMLGVRPTALDEALLATARGLAQVG
ncbi:NAD-dependent epimerase/dehydratase family protein [Streptacidiphilus jiangxiensis]|uniref:NAD-dependent epimerase/dehydratase family protein n=1 Tax=Streptacidiphilus jiangxiensis TaxID=235985 RepID=UPI0005AADD89|nr:NAD-dependent epimerase/dehydratase family protein [Streptacidiphilus jiangxiensis]